MRIALIGMSGVGKTYWATRLATLGFDAFHCDDRIGARLSAELARDLSTLEAMGTWMGMPYEEGFREREAHYLALEREALLEAIQLADARPDERNLLLDTTGSVVYMAEALLRQVRRSFTLVYLAITPTVHQAMLAAYMRRPRALVWGDAFVQSPHTSPTTALRESYRRLITQREARYEALCDLKIEYEVHRQGELDAQGFRQLLVEALG